MNCSQRKALIAVVLPLTVMLGWISYHWIKSESGTVVQLPIRGYDPRDKLSGHYLTFEVDFAQNPCDHSTAGKQRCVCIDLRNNTTLDAGTCDDASSRCDSYLRGHCERLRFRAGIERYYFPEKFRDVLRTVPQNSTVELSIDSEGRAIVRELFVNGQPILDYAKTEYVP